MNNYQNGALKQDTREDNQARMLISQRETIMLQCFPDMAIHKFGSIEIISELSKSKRRALKASKAMKIGFTDGWFFSIRKQVYRYLPK